MVKRVIFESKEDRELFFKKILESLKFKKWTAFRESFNIPKSTLELYRNGRRTMPEDFYKKLTNFFDEDSKSFFYNRVKILDSNWGSIKGGKSAYLRHKEIFEAGRKKAIKAIQKKAQKFDINMPLTKELSYFIGLFIGDGFTNKYYDHYIIQFVGDTRYERELYKLISEYSRSAFNLRPVIVDSKRGNWFRFNIYSKNLFEMITRRFRISAGVKSKTVLIPREILKAEPQILKACVRGLYDAEGCVFWDKRQIYRNPYPRIDLHMANSDILKQIHEILNKFCIKNDLILLRNNLRIVIWGPENVKKFVKEIGFSNPKHLEKLKGLKD